MKKILYSKPFWIRTSAEHYNIYNSLYEIKRDLILFDQIVYPNLDKFCEYLFKVLGRSHQFEVNLTINELQSLKQKGFIRDFKFDNAKIDWQSLISSARSPHDEATFTAVEAFLPLTRAELAELENRSQYCIKMLGEHEYSQLRWMKVCRQEELKSWLVTRAIQYLEGLDIIDSNPVVMVTNDNASIASNPLNQHNAFCFILGNLPMPADSTPWEQIIDFKADNDNALRLTRLRRWISNTLKSEFSEKELAEEYEYLLMEFEASIDRHRMKKKYSNLKAYVAAAPAIILELLVGKFEKLSDLLVDRSFSAVLGHIETMDAEANSTGKELAYSFFASEKFK